MELECSVPCEKQPTTSSILSQMEPIRSLQINFRKLYFNIILPSTSDSSEWSLPFTLLTKITYVPYFSYFLRAACSTDLIPLDLNCTQFSEVPYKIIDPLFQTFSLLYANNGILFRFFVFEIESSLVFGSTHYMLHLGHGLRPKDTLGSCSLKSSCQEETQTEAFSLGKEQ